MTRVISGKMINYLEDRVGSFFMGISLEASLAIALWVLIFIGLVALYKASF